MHYTLTTITIKLDVAPCSSARNPSPLSNRISTSNTPFGIATGVPVTFIFVGLDNQDNVAGFLDVMNVLIAEDAPPAVLTTSYRFDEFEMGDQLAK